MSENAPPFGTAYGELLFLLRTIARRSMCNEEEVELREREREVEEETEGENNVVGICCNWS